VIPILAWTSTRNNGRETVQRSRGITSDQPQKNTMSYNFTNLSQAAIVLVVAYFSGSTVLYCLKLIF
jgi:hypothetical protein